MVIFNIFRHVFNLCLSQKKKSNFTSLFSNINIRLTDAKRLRFVLCIGTKNVEVDCNETLGTFRGIDDNISEQSILEFNKLYNQRTHGIAF